MQHHGFSMDAVYVMKSNDAPHPVYDASLREFQFRKVEPPNVPVNIQYTPNPARLEDSQVQVAFADSPHQKTWRISEARDWRYLMEYILKTTKAKFIIFNQDDGEWITQFSLPTDPITNRWTGGMVSIAFERTTLRKFLDWIEDRWKEKPIDWTLDDFAREFGYKVPHLVGTVRHIGQVRSIED